jgi:hypothetical protein
MTYSIQFQYLRPGDSRPLDFCQDEEIVIEGGACVPVPDVGDSVSYLEKGRPVARKVLTRHFSYFGGHCAVNVVVTDLDPAEYKARLKE